MRILFLDQFSGLGGAQLCLREVLLEVRQHGWDAEVFAPGQGPLLDHARDCGFSAHRLPLVEYSTSGEAAAGLLGFGVGLARSAQAVRRVLRERPADLVYVNGPRMLPVAYLAMDGESRVPLVFHAHSVPTSRYARSVVDWTLRRTGATALACSQFAARHITKAVGGCTVVYNGVEDCGFRPRLGQHVRVGLLGRVAPEKGHEDFLDAAQMLAGDPRLRFSVTGSAVFSERRYERHIESRCAAQRVEYRGWMDNPGEVLHDLDILAVPSGPNEASTRVVMEALSAGCCVVAYPSGGLPELIRNGHSGILTERRDPAELAHAIRTLASSVEMRARLAVNGRREWEARFTVERFRRQVCDLLQAAGELRQQPASIATRSAAPETRPARDATRASAGIR